MSFEKPPKNESPEEQKEKLKEQCMEKQREILIEGIQSALRAIPSEELDKILEKLNKYRESHPAE